MALIWIWRILICSITVALISIAAWHIDGREEPGKGFISSFFIALVALVLLNIAPHLSYFDNEEWLDGASYEFSIENDILIVDSYTPGQGGGRPISATYKITIHETDIDNVSHYVNSRQYKTTRVTYASGVGIKGKVLQEIQVYDGHYFGASPYSFSLSNPLATVLPYSISLTPRYIFLISVPSTSVIFSAMFLLRILIDKIMGSTAFWRIERYFSRDGGR